jgi:hypothetical protein
MKEFLLELTGTSNYIIVAVGFIWAIVGMFANVLFSKKKININELGINLIAILLVMRFTSLIIGSDVFNASVGIVVGFSVEFIRDKILLIFTKKD